MWWNHGSRLSIDQITLSILLTRAVRKFTRFAWIWTRVVTQMERILNKVPMVRCQRFSFHTVRPLFDENKRTGGSSCLTTLPKREFRYGKFEMVTSEPYGNSRVNSAWSIVWIPYQVLSILRNPHEQRLSQIDGQRLLHTSQMLFSTLNLQQKTWQQACENKLFIKNNHI